MSGHEWKSLSFTENEINWLIDLVNQVSCIGGAALEVGSEAGISI